MTSPFLKWAGGKRWLVQQDLLPVPNQYNTYYEPFLGSAAVFFHLKPTASILADVNEDLVSLYQVMRDYPDELFKIMKEHHRNHNKEYYYKIRGMKCRTVIRQAAQFLYLNRTCWNGLYRVNLNGEFNVPIGTKDSVVFEEENFSEIAKTLENANIISADFEQIIDRAEEGDFIFIDPPYTVKHNLNGFLKYNEKIFSWEDQVRLLKAIERAKERGVFAVITNADHESIHELYGDVGHYQKILRHSKLAGDSTKRGATSEAMFTINFENFESYSTEKLKVSSNRLSG